MDRSAGLQLERLCPAYRIYTESFWILDLPLELWVCNPWCKHGHTVWWSVRPMSVDWMERCMDGKGKDGGRQGRGRRGREEGAKAWRSAGRTDGDRMDRGREACLCVVRRADATQDQLCPEKSPYLAIFLVNWLDWPWTLKFRQRPTPCIQSPALRIWQPCFSYLDEICLHISVVICDSTDYRALKLSCKNINDILFLPSPNMALEDPGQLLRDGQKAAQLCASSGLSAYGVT